MAAVFDDLERAVGVAGHLFAHRCQKHMILFPHHIENGNRQGAFAEVAHQRVDLGGEAKPALELFLAQFAHLAHLAQFAHLAHKEVARLLMVLARHDDESKQPVEPHIGQDMLAKSAQQYQHPR